ncbi:hypothetical protein BD779DRAFT_1447710 [Infundibulicybe gibba]|nr:hypothetical protein BD779DRAFT_1447710 [Infundibulicybe gibba]
MFHSAPAGSKPFSVKRSWLCQLKESTIFRDMLSIPQPRNPEVIEDSLIIRLPDAAEEVEHFFKAIFDDKYFQPPPAQTSFEAVKAILRLSHKYHVPSLRERALRHLDTAYPMTLAAWDERSVARSFPPATRFEDKFALLQIATEVSATWFLPSLFYSCCTYALDEMLDSPSWKGSDSMSMNRRACLVGYSKQHIATSRVLRFLLLPLKDGCELDGKCGLVAQRWLNIVDTWRMSIPLEVWSDGDWKKFSKDVCAPCLLNARRIHRLARQAFWDDLPNIYGQPAWAELEKLKKLALR